MPSIYDWSATPSSNTTVDGINIAENCPAANVNNALRSIMGLTRQTFASGLQNFLAGSAGLPVASGGTGLTSALTTNALVKQGATNFAQSIVSDDGTTATVAGNLSTTGNFGVGTTSPTQALDVRGNQIIIPVAGWSLGNTARLYLGDTSNGVQITNGGNVKIVAFNGVSQTVNGVDVGAIDGSGNYTITGALNCATLNPTNPLAVSKGGTGATTAANARISLGAAALGANGDITALTALSTAITVAQGGTNATTAAQARTNLGVDTAISTAVSAATVGTGQSWSAPGRSVGTSYQNTTGKPIMVAVEMNNSASNFQVSSDGVTWVTLGNGNFNGKCSAVIPNTHYYRVSGGLTVNFWTELA